MKHNYKNNNDQNRPFHAKKLTPNEKKNEKKNLFEMNNCNKEYFGHHDADYINLLNEYPHQTDYDEPVQQFRNVNTYNNGRSLYKDLESDKPRMTTDYEMKGNATSTLGLSVSDDEALEDYLNALAKNYDDIDRRIRNAERYVNHMDSSQSSNCPLKNGVKTNGTYCNSLRRSDENNIKYITELRVNIADSLKNNTSADTKRCNTDRRTEAHQQFIRSSSKIPSRKHNSPPIKKRSSLSIASSINDGNGSCSTQKGLFSTNLLNECRYSRYLNSDLEHVIVPPPKSFCSSDTKNEVKPQDKEIQTTDLNKYANNIFDQRVVEERGVQTIVDKEYLDIGIGTDCPSLKEVHKIIHCKSSSFDKSQSPDISDISKSNRTNLLSNAGIQKTVYTPNMHNKSFKSPHGRKKESTKNRQPFNLTEKSEHVTKPHDLEVESILKDKIASSSNEDDLTDKNSDSSTQLKSPDHKDSMKCNLSRKVEYSPENVESKDSAKNASMEIQRLLEKLSTRLKATMSIKATKSKDSKHQPSDDSNLASFWDNPLQKNDLLNSKSVSYPKPLKVTTKKNTRMSRKTNNVINSELQAICKTIGSNIKNEKNSVIINESSESENDFTELITPSNIGNLRSENMDLRQNLPSHNIGGIKKSTSNLNLAGDTKPPLNYKISKSFDLNPYDDIIKAHLNPIDRRVKSVASKNGCAIVIEGPICAYDSSTSHTFRNKVMYRCTISAAYKENLDKCVNYLKETFPNTFLKVNSRT